MQAISYIRVSTPRQGKSGLGEEAQRAAVQALCQGRAWEIIGEYVEVETGGNNLRPKLALARIQCEKTGARLVIAKLDRLSRDARFILDLQEAKVPFVCVDMPEADETVIGIMAILAQRERKMIAQRTKDALTHLSPEKRARRALAGSRNLTDEGRAKGRAAKCAKALVRYNGAIQHAQDLRALGKSLAETAKRLNETGQYKTHFYASTVQRMLRMAGQTQA